MYKVREKIANARLSHQLACLAVVCGVIGIPVLILLKMGWWLILFLLCYLILSVASNWVARTLRSIPMIVSPFGWMRKLLDLEERHVALLKYLKLKERLIPRHWKVEKIKADRAGK